MENKYINGPNTEELIQELIANKPSDDEFARWAKLGAQKRKKRLHIAKVFSICIALIAVFVFIGLLTDFEPESAEAGPDSRMVVESEMEKVQTFASQDELPDSIKEKFLLFPEMPEGYEVTEVAYEKQGEMEKLSIYSNNNKDLIYIDEILANKNTIMGEVSCTNACKLNWSGIEVSIEKYINLNQIHYNFKIDKVVIKMQVSDEISSEKVKVMVEKAFLNR